MAQQSIDVPAYVADLTAALQKAFPKAEIGTEQIRRDRYRWIIVDKSFEKLGHPERQRRVWAIAEESVKRASLMNVGMIITMAPSELPED
jgi:hypothetical protein